MSPNHRDLVGWEFRGVGCPARSARSVVITVVNTPDTARSPWEDLITSGVLCAPIVPYWCGRERPPLWRQSPPAAAEGQISGRRRPATGRPGGIPYLQPSTP